ncbi:hypothetical protein L211DRAFT_865536 [Terfezia boudieri ATCC MYA-4762]|uniref:F-box domain-containing protein n=1 Tax=Terfezia boudieri ATCC MYA-4762 TaxID=1051890 RepID=A0A3N4LWW5_9PEZI|nr:hypothetical protein L211DRAFT_865536 [Terfezia boudieri ATCC MYA-4762]
MAPTLTFAGQFLPPELLDAILTFIEPESDLEVDNNISLRYFHHLMQERQAALHALCLTSRALYAHCLPHLYRRIHWISGERVYFDPPLKLTLFLRTLVTRPGLAGLVQHIYLNGWNMRWHFGGLFPTYFTRRELALFSTTVSNIIRSQDYDVKYRKPAALAVVAISLMQGLRSIKLITHNEIYLDDFRSSYISDSVASPAEVAPVGMLAVLETLEITHNIPAGFLPSLPIPTLRNLKLATSRVAHFGSLLRCAPNLENLEFTLMRDVISRMETGNNWVDADELHRIIITAPCSQKLRRLAIEIYWFCRASTLEWGNWINFLCGIRGSLGPLTELRSLETLETSISTLLGWRHTSWKSADLSSMLPAALKKLRIGHELYMFDTEFLWEEPALMGLLEKLLSVRGKVAGDQGQKQHDEGRVGKLEEIVVLDELRPIDLPNPDDGWEPRFEPEEIEQLKSCCERWGVTFMVQVRRQKAERFFPGR